ncbi:hypothetical protein IEE_03947 [Bacillus cereus BAG5X1-1]|uniref:Uncharacterized protein n=1 Tax=Bacillus cereus BAG5X1-1 TaxID=1053189 RepID=J8AGZ2_BACCE|nr:hypothetical protein [Bacillus cereus]EJQ42382.1 hypothetical protein IEE_03947 [Bacillus cereus BAG5X1-1]
MTNTIEVKQVEEKLIGLVGKLVELKLQEAETTEENINLIESIAHTEVDILREVKLLILPDRSHSLDDAIAELLMAKQEDCGAITDLNDYEGDSKREHQRLLDRATVTGDSLAHAWDCFIDEFNHYTAK